MSEPKPEPQSFWSDLPKLLTGVGGAIAAAAALLTALHSIGVLAPSEPRPRPRLRPPLPPPPLPAHQRQNPLS